MLSADIGFLTCSISIILQYMQATFELEGASNEDTQWTLPSSRIARMEEITRACAAILCKCGQSQMTACIFTIWNFATNALWIWEKVNFPDQDPQTQMNLQLPDLPQKLSAVTDENFRQHDFKIPLALAALQELYTWLHEHFHEHVHPETFLAVKNGILVFETIEDILDIRTVALEAMELRARLTDSTGGPDPASASSNHWKKFGVVADEHVTGISLKPMGHSDLDIGMFESCLSDLLWNVECNTDVKFFLCAWHRRCQTILTAQRCLRGKRE